MRIYILFCEYCKVKKKNGSTINMSNKRIEDMPETWPKGFKFYHCAQCGSAVGLNDNDPLLKERSKILCDNCEIDQREPIKS